MLDKEDPRLLFRRLLQKLISWIIFLGLIQWGMAFYRTPHWELLGGLLSIPMIGLGFLSMYALVFSIFRSRPPTAEDWDRFWADWEKEKKRRHDEDDRRASDPFYW